MISISKQTTYVAKNAIIYFKEKINGFLSHGRVKAHFCVIIICLIIGWSYATYNQHYQGFVNCKVNALTSTYQLKMKIKFIKKPQFLNFKLLRTWQVELWTLLIPGSSTKTELWTHFSTAPKSLNIEPIWSLGWTQTQSQKKMNFELFRPRFI